MPEKIAFVIELTVVEIDALRDHASCRIFVVGQGEFSERDGSLRRILRVDNLERRAATQDEEYDDSAPPLWQSVIDLGASLPPEDWERLPTDLAANLDHVNGVLKDGAGKARSLAQNVLHRARKASGLE